MTLISESHDAGHTGGLFDVTFVIAATVAGMPERKSSTDTVGENLQFLVSSWQRFGR